MPYERLPESVPDPSRLALHKLWISTRRPVSEQTKAAKDLRQAGDLLDLLLADRPGDVQAAWEALAHHRKAAEAVKKALARLPAELQGKLA